MKTSILTMSLLILSYTSGKSALTSESFTKISIKGNAKVYIKQDSICSVKFTDNDKQTIKETSINNGTLIIDGIVTDEMHVTLPVLQEISIDGFGSVNGESTFNVDEVLLKIGGNGKINLKVNAKKIDGTITGFGKITLAGTTQDADFSIPGSGKIDANDLKTIRCNASISGIGKCEVDVIDELNSSISGTGTVTYKKLPKKLTENVSGIGNTKIEGDDDITIKINTEPDTTRLNFGLNQLLFIEKKDSVQIKIKKHKIKPIWRGFEMGLNSYVDNNGSFTLSPGKENFDLRVEKSVSVGLNILQDQIELGNSNVWIFTGLGITWNNYRFASDVVLENGPYTYANVDTSSNVGHLKSKLVAIYLTAPVMMEVFTSHKRKKAFHIGVGGIFGLRIGSHTKQKIEIDGDVSKRKEFDDFNLNPFRYGFRVAIGYRKFNIYADYYASTLFKDNKGPVLYPVNAGITFIAF